MDVDLSAVYREDATLDEQVAAVQHLIDTGSVWSMDGSTGRWAAAMIKEGYCVLGEVEHRDYYGNRVPSRYQIAPGHVGSVEYARKLRPDRWPV
jgi:hypothetical protein